MSFSVLNSGIWLNFITCSTDGEEQYNGVTHFEPTSKKNNLLHLYITYFDKKNFVPTDTRGAFPCWDEPAVKATFDISLVVLKDCGVLCNMVILYC